MYDLTERAKARDKQAFSSLIQAQTQSMYKIAIAILKNDEDAADAIQDTILACWEGISELRKPEYFKTWLTRILINNCNRIGKQHRRTQRYDSVPEATIYESAFDNLEWMDIVGRLDPIYAEVLLLYYGDRFKIREIADILNIGESSVKKRLVTARKKIESFYTRRKELRVI